MGKQDGEEDIDVKWESEPAPRLESDPEIETDAPQAAHTSGLSPLPTSMPGVDPRPTVKSHVDTVLQEYIEPITEKRFNEASLLARMEEVISRIEQAMSVMRQKPLSDADSRNEVIRIIGVARLTLYQIGQMLVKSHGS